MRDTQCKWYQTCLMKYFMEQGKLAKKWIENYCWNNWQDCLRFQLEEQGIYHPDNMLPDGEIDENNKSVSSGIYFYQLKVYGKVVKSKKMMMIK